MSKVVIGIDPHELSATIEVLDNRESALGAGRFSTGKVGFAAIRKYVKPWPERGWSTPEGTVVSLPLAVGTAVIFGDSRLTGIRTSSS